MKRKKRRHLFSGEAHSQELEEPTKGLITLRDTREFTEDGSRSIPTQERILIMFRHKILFFLDA